MSLSEAERRLLQRRLRRRRGPGPGLALAGLGLVMAALPVAIMLAGAIALGAAYAALADELSLGLESLENLETRASFQTIRIYDRRGTLLRESFTEGRRTRIPLSDIPLPLRQATIAAEDASFYENPGIDVLANVRAATQLLLYREIVSGGSTITQQLTRHVAFSDRERLSASYTRKAKELVLAVVMTQKYSKNQIFEWYLNEIYYGNLAYGVEAAARTLFGIPARELDLAQSALIAALPQSPAIYDPFSPDPEIRALVKSQQVKVLDRMVRNGFISGAEAAAAEAQELHFSDPNAGVFLAPHFVVYIGRVLEEMLGAEVMALGGLEVTTSLDLELQSATEQVVREHVERLVERHDMSNASVVVMEPGSGQILAMVGSKDYWDDSIDGRVNVSIRQRQPGSSIKPITYLAALLRGVPTSHVLWDVPMKRLTPQGLYAPKNYDDKFHGPVRMREALANSYNIPALKMLELVTVPEMLDVANRLGIASLRVADADRYGLSLTLGGGEVTLLEMATAFSVLAAAGQPVTPRAILTIRTSDGQTLYDLAHDVAGAAPAEPLVDPAAAYIVTDILSDNGARTPAFGSSSPMNIGVPAAVKTGTTDDYRDNWTVGYTPYATVAVWTGNSDNRPMRNSSGITGAAPIWREVMRGIAYNQERKDIVAEARRLVGLGLRDAFERPPGVETKAVCRLSSLTGLGAECPETSEELFVRDQVPETDDWVVAAAVVVPLPPPPEGHEGGWPPAKLCDPFGMFGMDRLRPVAVLPLPESEEERTEILAWAAESGWAALPPTEGCTLEMAAAALEGGPLTDFAGIAGYTPSQSYRLNLAPGSVLTTTTVLTGTALFDAGEVEYFKVELGQGADPVEWITLGDIHRQVVADGRLEVLDAPSLPPGDYVVRLVLVRRDGNFVRPPHSVPIRIGR